MIKKMIVSAGVAITYQDKILLIHPNGAMPHAKWGIPKGKQEPGEELYETASRELAEEVSIYVSPDILKALPQHGIKYRPARGGKSYKTIHAFHYHIQDLSQIGLKSLQVPISQIKYDENDMGRFMTYQEAADRMFWKQRPLIDKLNWLNK